MSATPVFHDLYGEQANGVCCVVCGSDFTLSGIRAVRVGVSGTTRLPVFACEQLCAPAVGYRPDGSEQMELTP